VLDLLANRLGWLVALGIALLLWLLRAAAREPTLRKDLRASVLSFGGYVLVYGAAEVLDAVRLPKMGEYAHVGGYLLFALGLIQGLVGISLWALRTRRGLITPKILRDVVEVGLFLVAMALILHHALKIDLGGLLATSAALSVVIGLALQETLGNLFAGLVLQVEPPFSVGDWISVGGHSGRVVQIAWRGTRLRTLRGEEITVPNAAIAKDSVINFSRSKDGIARDLSLQVGYSSPPHAVREACLQVLQSHPKVRAAPAPIVRVKSFAESGIEYQVRFYALDYADLDELTASLLSLFWYRLSREGYEIPFPTRTVHIARSAREHSRADQALELARLLGGIDVLAPLGEPGIRSLAELSSLQRFGAGEAVIRQGEAGDSLYLIVSGEVSVQTAEAGEVARLSRGSFFGEMSLLTGEPRSATVVACSDSTLLHVTHTAFATFLRSHEGVLRALSETLARRSADLREKAAGSSQPLPASVAMESNRIFAKLRDLFRL
jgi:small-conductance mechanosensitive channel/CRP-like cAMP-binding protein